MLRRSDAVEELVLLLLLLLLLLLSMMMVSSSSSLVLLLLLLLLLLLPISAPVPAVSLPNPSLLPPIPRIACNNEYKAAEVSL